MNTRNWITHAVTVAVLWGCGGDGGSSDPAPTISNLRWTPTSALQLPGERTTVNGTIDFADSGRNIVELHLSTSAGDTLAVPLTPPDASAGSLTGSFSVALDQIGQTGFEVWLQDSGGQVSNRLAGSFDVLVNDTVPRWRAAPGQAELTRLLGTHGLNGVASNGTRYVFVGGAIVVSSDLASWQVQSIASSLSSIAWSGSAFVAVGREPIYGGERDVLMRSSDGLTWTTQHMADHCPAPPPNTTPPPCEYKAGLSKVIWAGSQFVAVGRETMPGVGTFALVLTSPDGQAWTQQAKGIVPVGTDIDLVDVYGMGVSSVAWSGSRFVAVGRAADGTAALWTSTDTTSWSAGNVPAMPAAPPTPDEFTLRDIAWGLGRFVAVGWGGTLPPVAVRASATLSSTDGLSWQLNSSALPLSALNAVGAGPSRYLAVSTTDYATSTDGRTWAPQIAATGCGAAGVFWDGQRWIGVNGAEVCVSP